MNLAGVAQIGALGFVCVGSAKVLRFCWDSLRGDENNQVRKVKGGSFVYGMNVERAKVDKRWVRHVAHIPSDPSSLASKVYLDTKKC